MNKFILFPAITVVSPALLTRIFLSKLSITDEVVFVANCGKILFAAGTSNLISASLSNLPVILPRN